MIGPPYQLDESRRRLLRSKPGVSNGLDYVEVEDAPVREGDTAAAGRQLKLYFIFPLNEAHQKSLAEIGAIRVDHAGRTRAIEVERVEVEPQGVVWVTLANRGDRATYTLRLLTPGAEQPPAGMDPLLSAADFSFVVDGPVDADVLPLPASYPERRDEPAANYLAKDYAAFQLLIYDRLSQTLPDWEQRHVPDLMVTLVELLAYAGDYLSYAQDAVATEAYLSTALHRTSVRRHARLVDYRMHEGCNARAWVCVEVSRNITFYHPPAFIPGLPSAAPVANAQELQTAAAGGAAIFAAMFTRAVELKSARNTIELYSWGGAVRAMAEGATTATLIDPGGGLDLSAGDVLLFETVDDSTSGGQPSVWRADSDARPTSHAVRLTYVRRTDDLVTGSQLLEVGWSTADALPREFPLRSTGGNWRTVARGNVILADHGHLVREELVLHASAHNGTPSPLRLSQSNVTHAAPFPDPAAAAHFQAALVTGGAAGSADRASPLPPRRAGRDEAARRDHVRRLLLAQARQGYELPDAARERIASWIGTQEMARSGLDQPLGSATSALRQDLAGALPVIELIEVSAATGPEDFQRGTMDERPTAESGGAVKWSVRRDLLDSAPTDRHFVAEADDQGVIWLRFGNDELGARPSSTSRFLASYRVGNGPAGNVGAGQIRTLVARDAEDAGAATAVMRVWNPLPATAGLAPEPVEDVKLYAPNAYRRRLERAVTADDYAQLARQVPGVADASARVVDVGGFSTVVVAVRFNPHQIIADRQADILDDVRDDLTRLRRIGHAVQVIPARQVPLEVTLDVELEPHRLRGAVEADLLDVLGSHRRAGGQLGFFHPRRLGLGQSLYSSELLAAAQEVAGVRSVQVTGLRRLDRAAPDGVPAVLALRPHEVPLLENDSRHPSHGHLVLNIRGGR